MFGEIFSILTISLFTHINFLLQCSRLLFLICPYFLLAALSDYAQKSNIHSGLYPISIEYTCPSNKTLFVCFDMIKRYEGIYEQC